MSSKKLDNFMKFGTIPASLESYMKEGGYEGLKNALKMKPEKVIGEVEDAVLLGRGGAGFPTGRKWRSITDNSEVYIVCNADEGEPGTFKDRFLMTHAPFMLLEGMTIAAYAVGAGKGYIYIRGEYPDEFEILKKSISEAEKAGLLGKNIDGKFSFSVDVKLGGGSYVVGDETALLNSLMGFRGTPWKKPPYPADKGVWDKPTIINNVETLACVPLILKKGSKWFRNIGEPASPGPKLYCVSGKVNSPGIYEFGCGVQLGELIEEAGGVDGDFKAVQIGGTAGPIYNRKALDYKLDFNSMRSVGGTLGSGAVVVMNASVSMAEVLEVEMRFFAEESCGKCFPCRYGTRQLSYMANNIVRGNGKEEYLDLMVDTAAVMKAASFCPFGKSVELPVNTLMNTFGGEIRSLIHEQNYVREGSL